MISKIDESLKTGDPQHIDGPQGMVAASQAYINDLQATGPLRDAYINAHHLRMISK